jgi:hypothetical protein
MRLEWLKGRKTAFTNDLEKEKTSQIRKFQYFALNATDLLVRNAEIDF